MPKMWFKRFYTQKNMEDGWPSRQKRKENAAGNRTFRLSKMQQSFPGSVRQKEDLSRSNVAPCPLEKGSICPNRRYRSELGSEDIES